MAETRTPHADAHNVVKLADAKLTPTEAARYLGVAKGTLAKWRVYGTGPRFLKLGHRVVYDRRDLEAFADAGRRCSTSEQPPAA